MKIHFYYTGVRVKDLDESVAFYTSVLGMKLIRRIPINATQGEVAELASEDGGSMLELNYYPEGTKFYTKYSAGEELDHLAFKVENLEDFVLKAKKQGYPVELEVKSDSSKWAYIKDPNGIFIELVD
jgi:lactoylglutathione lyase